MNEQHPRPARIVLHGPDGEIFQVIEVPQRPEHDYHFDDTTDDAPPPQETE